MTRLILDSIRLDQEKGNGSPARSWFGHGNGSNRFPGNHKGDESLNLSLAAIVTDVWDHDVRVERESRS